MNPRDHLRTDAALDDEAAAWLCERDEGFTPERAQAFADWRDADPRQAAAVARVGRALALLGEMPAVRAPLEARFGRVKATAAPARRGRVVRLPFRLWSAGIAAALVVGLAAWWSAPLRAPVSERYAAGAATPRRVALRDGSVVDLNAGSDVRVQFTLRERHVALSVGEAHFEVAHDAARPFVVAAGGVSVRAVGTAFNVQLAAGAVDVLVVEGKVEVTRATAPANAADAPSLLAAGDRARISRDDPTTAPTIVKAAPAAIRATLAWQDPLTTFNDVPLREVVTRLNQRNETQLVLDEAALGERKIGGVIALDQVEAFVRLLEQDGDVVAERRSATEIGLRRAR